MSDLIDRRALIAELKREAACGDRDYEKGLLIAVDITDLFPSADAVQVVRCKDCWWKQGAECVRFAEVRVSPDDFCSRGTRWKQ